VLDYLRRKERLTGTKEGCKEGDCGACVVLVGELQGERVVYTPQTSCLIPLGELRAKHLVTVEGLNMEKLSPVQQAIVDAGGSQCGFCTPGIVVSLTGYLLGEEKLSMEGIKTALGGHLCRCTGYTSLKEAGTQILQFLEEFLASSNNRVETLATHKVIPEYFRTIPERLREIAKMTQER
jgi:xanthine dehydrogenase small subunit